MNKELAIKGLKENLCSLCAYGSQNMDSCDIRECDNRDYIKALEQQPSDDCVSRKKVIKAIDKHTFSTDDGLYLDEDITIILEEIPPVTPTQCIAVVRFSKDDLRDICNERIEIECTHGTCKDCEQSECLGEECYCNNVDEYFDKDFYCADFEKRGSENGI